MCLKKKKDLKRKKEISVRSASRLDDKEKKLVSKEMHAVYNEHMDKKKLEFKPANLEEINVLVKDINDHDFIIKESIKEQNNITDKLSIGSKKVSSRKNSQCNSIASNNSSHKSKQNVIQEEFVLINNSNTSNSKEKTVHEKSCTVNEIFEKEMQEKQIDLSSECSIESDENNKVDSKHTLDTSEIEVEKEIKLMNDKIIHNYTTENELNEKIESFEKKQLLEEMHLLKEMQSFEKIQSHEKIQSLEEIQLLKEMQSFEKIQSHEKIQSLEEIQSFEKIHSDEKIHSLEKIHSFGKLDKDYVETLPLSQEIKEEPLIHNCEISNDTKNIIDNEKTYLGYYIPDKESVCNDDDILKNTYKNNINKSIDNLVEDIKDTINTVKNLVGEEKLDHQEDENNNYNFENHKNININSSKYEEENILLKSTIVKNEINNSTNTIVEANHKDNIITTTFYKEVLNHKDDNLKYSSNESNKFYNSTNQYENTEHTEHTIVSKVESIKNTNTINEVILQNEKNNVKHIISNDLTNIQNEVCNENKIINQSHTSSIHSKTDKITDSIKRNSLNYSLISNVSTVSDDSLKKNSSIVSKQSKSTRHSPIKYSSKHHIMDDIEINENLHYDNKIIHHSNDVSLLYKSKRKAGSIKSIDTTLSYGYPTKKHIINDKSYKEIKKITEYQIDNKMNFNGKCNGYYLIKPQMVQNVCKYTGGVKIIIGGYQNKSTNDKKIILFGTKGSGKTTLINNYCNILFGVGRECNFRFIINSPDEIEPTKNIVTYEFNNTILGYKFTIIDTPGFDCSKSTNDTFSYKSLYEIYLKNYISKANRILIHGVSIVIRNEDDIWNPRFYRQISGIRRIFCGNYENKYLYPIVTNAKAFSKLNYFNEKLHGVYDHNDIDKNYKNESKMRKATKRRANWYTDIFRITSNIYEVNFEGKRTLDKIYLFNESEAACDRLFNTLQYNVPILLKKTQRTFETINEC
uniref:G domain-containing protein n=1 Tax=Strongyloides stercoralis TaxID=6248 RepID=A0A0K0DWS6_STRER